jgi:hypothetical protein
MSGSYEGDLIRPLGLVTLNFGYAEGQVNFLLILLRENGLDIKVSSTASFGQRISKVTSTINQLDCASSSEVINILAESKALLERRNSLIHACIFTKGRVVPTDNKVQQYHITPRELTDLANQVFDWKERLDAAVQRRLIPELKMLKKQHA